MSNIERAFEDKLRAIGAEDRRSSYAQFAEIYRGVAELRKGEIAKARERFQPFSIEMLPKGGKLTREALLTELTLLAKAKVLTADDSTKLEGQALLKELCSQGKVVSGEALLSYLKIFGADQALVDQTLQAHPALRESLKGELTALGVTV